MLELKLYGKPRVQHGETALAISLKKSEAVLYYIAYQGRVTRDELIDLIWQETDVNTSRKNLRNCLYRLKKDLDEDVFLNPSKNIIEINTDKVNIDLGDMQAFIQNYTGNFLEGFVLAESPSFEAWVRDVNQSLKQKYAKVGRQQIEIYCSERKWDEAIEITMTLLKIDPYDERLTREIMRYYAELGHYNAIMNQYESLKQRLSEDLGVTPEKDTMTCYFKLLNQRMQAMPEKQLFERRDELAAITETLDNIIIVGEAGVGKTALMDAAVAKAESSNFTLKVSCYQTEMNFNLKIWDEILNGLYTEFQKKLKIPGQVLQILARTFPSFMFYTETQLTENTGSLNFSFIEKIVCDIVTASAKLKPLTLYIEDMQWMDGTSMRLLTQVLLKCPQIRLLGTARNEFTNDFDLMRKTLTSYKKLKWMILSRFDKEASFRFMTYLNDVKLSTAQMDKLYEESEGNAFFIVELLRLSPEQWGDSKLEDLIGARFLGLEPESEKILHLLVPFFDYAQYEMLRDLYSGDEEQLLNALGMLKNRYLIQEVTLEHGLAYRFTHHKLRTYLYETMDRMKLKLLHKRVAEAWRQKLALSGVDIFIYQRLMYHYQASDETALYLEYYLKYLETYFDFSHELYPEMMTKSVEVIDDQPELRFSMLNKLIRKAELQNIDVTAQSNKYHLMYGRYLIRQGYYDVGLREIQTLIESAKQIGDENLLFKGYVQKIYHAIQIVDHKSILESVERMEALNPSEKRKAMLCRFKGIYEMMIGQHEQARAYFMESVQIFESLNDRSRYSLNIAAAYNYISEAFRDEKEFDLALQNVEKAIEICMDGNILRGLSIFNTNAGIIAYQMGNRQKAKSYLQAALASYEQIDTLWRRGDAEAYLGLMCLESNEVHMATAYLNKAVEHAEKIENPNTLAIIEQLKQQIEDYHRNNQNKA